MKLGKIFKLAKKGSKMASRGSGTGAPGEFDWPDGVRIAVYGHANSGKTVYFTVLNEDCKISRDLQISVNDNATAGEFLQNYRLLWGIGATTSVGTVVDLKEEKKFPNSTRGDRLLQFNAILDGDKMPVVSYDYDGRAVEIGEPHELTNKVNDFVQGADGVLYFFDPKSLGAEIQCQAHCASFVNMLERLAPLNKRLDIPVALVITKADILPGFNSDAQTVLVPPEEESYLAEDYEIFLERILSSNRIQSDTAWAGSVRDTLVKLKEFLKVVVGRTLNFQIFFVSSTGQSPEKIGTDVGRSIYAPPAKITPVGVKMPFRWVLESIRRSRSIAKFRKLAKYVAVLSLIWVAAFSAPYLYHFQWLLDRTTAVETDILNSYDGNVLNTSSDERSKIIRAYDKYEYSWIAKWLFEDFLVPARQIKNYYKNFNIGEAIGKLDGVLARETAIVKDSALWPTVNPANDSLVLNESHTKLEADLGSFHQGDETSILYTRSGRALVYWDLFKQAIVNPSDSAPWATLSRQVSHDRGLYAGDMSPKENTLGDALIGASTAREKRKVASQAVAKAAGEFDDLVAKIKRSDDPEYLLVTAVKELKAIRSKLTSNPARAEDVEKINTYLSQASYFDKSQQYKFTLTNCPDGHHLHIMVKKGGEDGSWPMGKQLLKGRSSSITWKSGDQIVIALDANDHGGNGEQWGEVSKAKVELKSKTAIFEMNGNITFPSGEVISISLDDDPKDKLPGF
ncbi:MAG TPA: hypothetical protein PLF13_09485 [candidate division Zixibacteria bacterium]|nr:hypothetical protein [candidate division Zixibacteria bacterium]